VNAQNKNGETPLHKSIFNNSVRLLMVDLLLGAGADVNLLNIRGESSLHFAVHLGREDLVAVLVKAGADVTIRGIDKKTAYELALQGSNVKVKQVLKNVQDVYDWLLSLGLEQYWKVFVREEISKDLLPDLNEQILDSMGITSAGHRIKILKNCKQMKRMLTLFPFV
jgi:ankyrin repeat protein